MTEEATVTEPIAAARPEPVLSAARQAGWIAGLVGAIATALGAYGAISGQRWAVDAAAIVTAIGTGLAGAMPSITAAGARAQVTPLANPQAVDGAPLVVDKPVDVSVSMGPDL